MSDQSSHVSYPRGEIIEVLRTLEELVVSLGQIGSACSEMDKPEQNSVLSAFIRDHDIFRKAAGARRIMSAAFSYAPGADGMDDWNAPCKMCRAGPSRTLQEWQ